MLDTLRRRNFALLWTAGLVSLTGDWVLFVALPIYVFQITGSPLATSGMFVAEIVPALMLGSVAGTFVDRWDRRRTMIICNLLLMVALLPLLLVHSAGQVWIVYVAAFVTSAVSQFFGPAVNALMPLLVDEQHLVPANSLNSLSNNFARLVGPSIGGAIAVVSGLAGVTLVDAASFLIAALLIAFIRIAGRVNKDRVASVKDAALKSWQAVWREWLDGLALMRRDRSITVLLFVATIPYLGEGVVAVMIVVWVEQVLKGGALELGWLMSAQAVGGLVGGLLIAHIGNRFPTIQLAGVGMALFGLIDIALFTYPLFFPGLALGLALIAVVGIPASAAMTGLTTLLQTNTRDEYRGRIFGALNTTSALLRLAGTLVAGFLGAALGPILMLALMQGGSYLLGGILALLLLPAAARHARRMESARESSTRETRPSSTPH